MSLLPRRGPGRHGQSSGVAVHPGWTLSPTSVTEPPAPKPEAAPETAVPASRWTSSPAVPAPVAQRPPLEPVVEPVVEALSEPVVEAVTPAVVEEPVEPHWVTEWEAVAATRATPSTPDTLHTAAVAALNAVFGTPAAPAGFLQPQPAPGLSALDLPMPLVGRETETPLAYEAARAVPPLPTRPAPPPVVTQSPAPAPQPVAGVAPPRPAPPAGSPVPTMPPPVGPPARTTSVPSSARHVLARAIRTAPAAPVQHRSTVRLGFADASVIDLRPDDPIAKALHTV
ncbi:MAG: hypothetical protein QOD91_2060, partial [Frankiales bacterium]|nr:hypothetical protein [Frankiales bacterium]